MRATVHRQLAAASVLAVAVIAGCEAPPQAGPSVTPVARMVGLQVEDARMDYATLVFAVEIGNPGATDLSVTGLHYALTSGGNLFGSAEPVTDVTVPAKSVKALSLTHRVVYNRLLRALDAQPGSTIPFKCELRLSTEAAHRQLALVSVSDEGRLFLPLTTSDEAGAGAAQTVDVIYLATPQDVVERMLRMAVVKPGDLVYDLGCGDGRIVVTAAKQYGCRAVGYDIDPHRVKEARENVRQGGLESLVTIEQQDIFTVDLAPADVVTLYLSPLVNRRLIPRLQALKPGSRIVSHTFPLGDIKPDESTTVTSREDGREHHIYLWFAPLKVD